MGIARHWGFWHLGVGSLKLSQVRSKTLFQHECLAAPEFTRSCLWPDATLATALETPVVKIVVAPFARKAGTVDVARQDLVALVDLSGRVYRQLLE